LKESSESTLVFGLWSWVLGLGSYVFGLAAFAFHHCS
jgi:hypothetical protein